jgi:peroxiredoxin
MRKLLVAIALSLGLMSPVAANPDFDLGPPIGARAPSIGTPRDATGQARSMQSLMGDKGLVFFFFRTTVWCPYCAAQLLAMNAGIAEIERRGYHLAGISYDPPEPEAAFTKKWNIRFTLLADPKSEVIDRYKLRDPLYPPGNLAYGVPRPIIFILDRNGTIRAKLYEDTFKKRPPVSLVLETLDKLSSAQK